jgi:PAS domain S-box-containing protein
VLADGLPQIVWIMRPDGTVEYMNREWTKYTGLSQSEISPEDWRKVTHPEDIENNLAEHRRARETSSSIDVEFRLRGIDGNYRWFRACSEPVWDSEGKIFRRFGTATDIDDTKKMQAQMAEYQTLSETVPIIVWMSDLTGKMIYANSQWEEITGVAPTEVTFARWADVIHPDDAPETQARWRAAGAHGLPYEAEFRLRCKDGSYRWVFRRSAPVKDAAGKTVKWIGIAVDISEQKRLEEDLRSAISSRDQFLAVCSHELKTPLTLLELHAESFRRKALRGLPEDLSPEALKKYFDRLSPHLKRLNHRINDMLDVTRIASGRLSLELHPVDLVAVTRAALDNLSPQIELSGCVVTFDDHSPVECECDSIRIEQVINNLVENALKYGKGKPIEIQVRRVGETVLLKVIDHGPGIAQVDLGRIFGKFERAAEGTGVSGLGLGLHIAAEIVTAHGGKLEVSSEPGNGSVFTVSLAAQPGDGFEMPGVGK